MKIEAKELIMIISMLVVLFLSVVNYGILREVQADANGIVEAMSR
jgi:hypothetical protein